MIEVSHLSLSRGNFHLRTADFSIASGEYAVLMGPSGCGKSSLLECLAGLVPSAKGSIHLSGRDVTNIPAAARGIGYVPQDGALFRGLSVRENLSFALEIRRWSESQISQRIGEVAELVGVVDLLDRGIAGLSGGERQRVALGRALSFHPLLLLLDEPMASLDESAREGLFDVMEQLKQRAETTVLHVTHSSAEADRLATLRFSCDTLFLPPS